MALLLAWPLLTSRLTYPTSKLPLLTLILILPHCGPNRTTIKYGFPYFDYYCYRYYSIAYLLFYFVTGRDLVFSHIGRESQVPDRREFYTSRRKQSRLGWPGTQWKMRSNLLQHSILPPEHHPRYKRIPKAIKKEGHFILTNGSLSL